VKLIVAPVLPVSEMPLPSPSLPSEIAPVNWCVLVAVTFEIVTSEPTSSVMVPP
jgi:hypothetical protein